MVPHTAHYPVSVLLVFENQTAVNGFQFLVTDITFSFAFFLQQQHSFVHTYVPCMGMCQFFVCKMFWVITIYSMSLKQKMLYCYGLCLHIIQFPCFAVAHCANYLSNDTFLTLQVYFPSSIVSDLVMVLFSMDKYRSMGTSVQSHQKTNKK